MPRYILLAFWMAAIFIQFNSAYSQSSIEVYNIAKSQYENGSYTYAIQNLKALEQSIGANPKIQSLLVYTYVANNDFINAKIAIEKYKKLAVYASSEAHQKLLQQEEVINAGLRNLEEEFRNKEMTPERKIWAARTAIHETYSPYNQTKSQMEIESIRNKLEISSRLEKKYNEKLQQITNTVATELNKKNNTFPQEQEYFNQIGLSSITVGNVKWTTENLKVTYFRDGTPIVMAKNEDDWVNYFHAGIPCWRYLQYDSNQDPRLGLEYNMYALMSDKQIAPEGWRVPTINDWKNFSKNVGDWNELYIRDAVFTLATKDGNKQYGAAYWNSVHRFHESRVLKLKGKNKSNFSAIPNRTMSFYEKGPENNDNRKASWWAMTTKKDWLMKKYIVNENLLEVWKEYDTEVAAFYFTNSYDIGVPYAKNTIFIYWNFLKEDKRAEAQRRKPRYLNSHDWNYTYDITRYDINGYINTEKNKRTSDHIEGYPIRLIQ